MKKSCFDVLLAPIFSEKATIASDKFNKCTFLVHKTATKPTVARAFQAIYGVKPLAVNIINRKGVQKKTKRGGYYQTVSKKMAIVSLSASANIDVTLEV